MARCRKCRARRACEEDPRRRPLGRTYDSRDPARPEPRRYSELRQLTDNAKTAFGLIVCFGCNRAFETKDEQVKNCPNCGAKIPGPRLTPPETRKNQTLEKPKKATTPPSEKKTKRQNNKKETEKPEKQQTRKGKQNNPT